MDFKNNWETAELQLGRGLDTKTEEKALTSGKLLVLENAEFTKIGALAKRTGYQRVAFEDRLGELVPPRVLATRDEELLACNQDRLYSYSPTMDEASAPRWVSKGELMMPTVTTAPAMKERYTQSAGDYAEAQGVGVYAWVRAGAGVYYSVVDAASGTVHKSATSLDANGSVPRVVSVGGVLHIYYASVSTNDIKLKIIRPFDIQASVAAAVTDVVTDLDSDGIFQVKQYDTGTVVFVYYVSTGATHGGFVKANGDVITSVTDGYAAYPVVLITVAAGVTPTCLDVSVTEDQRHMAMAYGTASSAYVSMYQGAFGAVDVDVSLVDSGATTKVAVAASRRVYLPDAANTRAWHVFSEESGLVRARVYRADTGSLAANDSQVAYRVGLGSGAFSTLEGACVHLTYNGTLTDTYFLWYSRYQLGLGDLNDIVHSSSVQGRLFPGTSGGAVSGYRVPGVHVDGDTLKWVAVTKTRLEGNVDASPQYTEDNLSLVTYDFGTPAGWVQSGQSTYLGGAQMHSYDGVTLCEAGFGWFPEMTAAGNFSNVVDGTSGLANGDYSWIGYYEWLNERNEIERSTGVLVTHTAVVGSKVRITFPTYTLTRKPNVTLVVYRTAINPAQGAARYRVTSLNPAATGNNGWAANSTTAASVTIDDGMSDATLLTKELDYQNTGEADNVPPFAPTIVASGKDRVFTAGGDHPVGTLLYSKYEDPYNAVRFHDAFQVAVDPGSGPITALSVLQDILVVFKRGSIWAVEGDGANNLVQGDFAPARLVSRDVGCLSHNAVVSTPAGIMFQSAKGIYTLAGGQPQYIGADVEAHTADARVVSATLVGDKNQVIFLMDSGKALVFDYLVGQWVVFTGHDGRSGTVFQDRYAYALSDRAEVFWSNSGYLDGSAPYSMRLRTGWVRPGQAQGFTLWRYLGILGTYRYGHTLNVKVWQDYEPQPRDTFTFLPRDTTTAGTKPSETAYWGTPDSPMRNWGEGDGFWGFYGQDDACDPDYSASLVYSYTHGFKHQKAAAVSIEIFDTKPTPYGGDALVGDPNQGFELTALAFQYKARTGLSRLGDARKMN
jgi:hypothetical protein